eukprot:scaffold121229_cov60-Attheya_sp.AAC.4
MVTGVSLFYKDLYHAIEYQVERRTLKMGYYADEQWTSFNRLIELMKMHTIRHTLVNYECAFSILRQHDPHKAQSTMIIPKSLQ